MKHDEQQTGGTQTLTHMDTRTHTTREQFTPAIHVEDTTQHNTIHRTTPHQHHDTTPSQHTAHYTNNGRMNGEQQEKYTNTGQEILILVGEKKEQRKKLKETKQNINTKKQQL
jgi:hypothetical protein